MTNNKDKYNNNLNDPEEFASELSKIKKENNFQVPENYFAELPQRIQEKATKKKVQFSFGNMYNYFTKPMQAIAVGSVMAIILIGLFVISNQKREDIQITVEISFEDIMQEYPYLIEYMDDHLLIEFAAARMNDLDLNILDLKPGFDLILLEDEWILNISDEEIIEIMYNL